MKLIVAVILSLIVCIPICNAAVPTSSPNIELKKDPFTKEPITRVEQLERVLILELQRKIHTQM
ncbi:hypothetical protein [Paenibacillus sp. BC26]|uniref:hypothetical protein n=1 Tax=Paenibacillus sp. BC26 TaxID=1881032 RepID=UPI0008E1B5A9|nr:hypothetical protein [Paenibacillus sp. BC26]SFS67625.1 hypothetical protein SAMN05428962_2093 [Paenibacillus sp. BC26]